MKSNGKKLYLYSAILGVLLVGQSAFAEGSEQGISEKNTMTTTSADIRIQDSSNATDLQDNLQTSNSETDTSESTEETKEPEYDFGLPSGRSNLVSGAMLFSDTRGLSRISINDKNHPAANFIDISSHNGNISVADYQKMSSYGVTGVVVKISEATNYTNPYAANQINNAKAAGMKVSAYHYSWFTTAAQAREEARYFASFVEKLGLSKDTVMVNDIEEQQIKDSKYHTQNSQAFTQELNQRGYRNVTHYVGLHWINEGRINTSALQNKNIWVAAYPYNPSGQMYTQYGAWQWTSSMTFPGISGTFDMSSDYTGTYSNPSNGNGQEMDYKDNVISQRNMSQIRYVNTNGGAIYSRPYQKGDGAVDYTSGLLNTDVTVTKEVVNGHGTWQQFTYTKNGQNRTGWIQAREFKDILKKEKYNNRKVLDKNFAVLYDQPYYPGVKSLLDIRNQRGMQVSISEKARTGYGEWYKVSYTLNGMNQSGWMKSTDFTDTLPAKPINKNITVNRNNGLIYNEAYRGDLTRIVGNTSGMLGKEIKVTEEQQTSYGLWYKTSFTQNGRQVSGWIKSTDTDDYRGYQKVNEEFYVNKDYGLIYESPYTSNKVQAIGNLNGKLNQFFQATVKVTTDYGEWYKISFKNAANQDVIGWIKSVDLNKNLTIRKNNFKASFNKNYGIVYDSPYVNDSKTKEVGRLNGRQGNTITVTEEAKTPAGLWYHTRIAINGVEKKVWASANDVSHFYNYQSLETKRAINKNYGAVYDRPYDGDQTQLINNLNGKKDHIIDIDASAETSYGTWYRAIINNNSKRTIGWVKSIDLIDEKTNQRTLNQKAQVTQEYGILYNDAYVGPRQTKQIGRTKPFYKEEITLLEQVTTAYGTWYRFEGRLGNSDKMQNLWIKSVDLRLS
ncbi:GH25 family lysozyme [Vagococcus vulneris]|uniref:GW domain-containing protein n=1 Tax=Vagococcus vulneris TaxID=1977869 RepID=A0A429ZZB1_9ENTE|nr:GH25 family lysozyme [Vagococcus vulneris]RST99352.1 hypothetical protein CBF37_05115 [Vagococcus vulneris]